ncbi:glycosyl transferase family 90 [Mesorhizobium sp. ZMM04-5]|uniref:Glycosyl transferase family 90 n=1 Tax=Mesorhizobium marinum TaxID=3228790 RepID=A0ABV3R4X9_9HYPH
MSAGPADQSNADWTREEALYMEHAERLIASAPIPVVLRKQGRYGASRLMLGHLLGSLELHCSLERGKLRILYRKPWIIRLQQLANLIAEAVAMLGCRSLPPFYVNSGDKPSDTGTRPITVFGACAQAGHPVVAAPDFVFNGWPEARFLDFDGKVASLCEASAAMPTHDLAFWTGQGGFPARRALVEHASRHPDTIRAVDAQTTSHPSGTVYLGGFTTMEEQVAQYRYMIDVEGSGYSGRLKLLLHAGRSVLVIDRPYQEFYFGDLEPFRHYVPVSRYSSNLAEQVDWLRSNPAREKEIVGEAREFARARLTRRAAVERWARLLEQHAHAGGKLRSG